MTWSAGRPSPTRRWRRAWSRPSPPPAPKTHPVDLDLVPGATFCHPRVASVGLTRGPGERAGPRCEDREARSAESGPAPSTTTATAWSSWSWTRYGEIVGAHIVGNRACDMIAELVAVMALEGGIQELQRIMHHPTISEAVLDAAGAVDKWATHA